MLLEESVVPMSKGSIFKLSGWPKSPHGFLHKIKDTLFIFTNSFIDVDSLSVSLCPMWCNVGCSQLRSRSDRCQLQLVSPTSEHRPARNLQPETSQTTFDIFMLQLHTYLS